MTLTELKKAGEAPEFLTEEGFKTLSNGYLLPDETPMSMYKRLAKAAASYYTNVNHWEGKFLNALLNNWLCPSSPVASNFGSNRGLPISCNSVHVKDTLVEPNGIMAKATELAALTKHGAGVGVFLGDVRARGTPIKGNGKSEGVIPWCKIYDSVITGTNQGNTRRGAAALFLPVEHGDIDEFINIRRPVGDMNRRCLNINHGVCITDDWMKSMLAGDSKKRNLWQELLRNRVETGEPYLVFNDNVNNQNPECYVKNNLKVSTSNICSEITLYTDPEHSFVCCLSSLNLARWDEWKDTDAPEVAVRFLDAVLEDYIIKTENMTSMDNSRRSAIKGRAIGVGVLGWHTLLQNKNIPFDSFDAMMLNSEIFKTIKQRALNESRQLAVEKGEPEWCKGFGIRNTHLLAVAPTVSNSIISGGHSAGIEPIAANIFSQKSAKGTFIVKNKTLIELLKTKNKDTSDVWKSINEQGGSVQHLSFLTDHEKAVFLTAREINQYAIIKQASQRQKYICQGQSINLFFGANADPKYIHGVHIEAWKTGIKSLYYFRTEGVIKGDFASRTKDECASCEG